MSMGGAVARVLVLDDDDAVRHTIGAWLCRGGHSVASSIGRGDELRSVRLHDVDAAIVDLGLPGISGLEVIADLKSARPEMPVLVLTAHDDPTHVLEAFRQGASGYLLKGGSLRGVASAVDDVLAGSAPLSPAAARHVLAELRGQATTLTPRERELLECFASGLGYADAAAALKMSVGTVQTHVKNLYRKLGVSSKAEAVGLAVARRLIERPARAATGT
jgi:DNA-binding NarL/FixJ family response regulator